MKRRARNVVRIGSVAVLAVSVAACDLTADRDVDGIPDWAEVVYGFDPDNADENGNGVLDGDEDADGDSLSNSEEVKEFGSNPRNGDADGDGLRDGDEAVLGTNPHLADSDFDGLRDDRELVWSGTDPTRADSDDDGLDDGDEWLGYGTDPLDPDTD